MSAINRLKTQILIIGAGGAGVRAALKAQESGKDVTLLCKGVISKCGLTPMAYPSIQASFGYEDARDNSEVHFRDIIDGGRGLSDQNLARALADESTQRVRELVEMGVKFEEKDGHLLQVIHPGQTYPRNMVINSGGYGIISGLKRQLKQLPGIKVLEDCYATKLFVKDGAAAGALVVDMRSGSFVLIEAESIIMATGGYESFWGRTDAGPDSTGDGLALLYRAGALLIDLEMILYYPSVVCADSARGILLQYETLLRGEYAGGQLINSEGKNLIPSGIPPTRDVLMDLMFKEAEQGHAGPNGGMFIDMSKSTKSPEYLEELMSKLFSLNGKNLTLQGINFSKGPVEVAPAVHFTLGGVRINERCETSIPGLFACGEVSSNLHGANRISGNALAETQVFGYRAGAAAAAFAAKRRPAISDGEIRDEIERIQVFAAKDIGKGIRPIELKRRISDIMDSKVGPRRSEASLTAAIRELQQVQSLLPQVAGGAVGDVFNYELCEAIELANMVELGILIAKSALFRTETRGHHIRTDYPDINPNWCVHTATQRGKELNTVEVTQLVQSLR